MANEPSDFEDLVSQFVLGSIRRPIDTLGVRRTDVSFTDIQEAAAGVFLLYPKATYYVLFLAAQRLQELIEAEAEAIDELMRLLGATGRTVVPVKDLTPLSNITSALFELERAIGQRTEAFKDISEVPAFKRFDENVQRFLDGPGLNVKDNGELVETPQEARTKIPALVTLLQDSHAEIIRRAGLIQNGLANYEKVNLPALAASGVISRSRNVIQSRTSSLSVLSPIDRLTQNKDTVLELLASRSIVRQFGSFSRPESVFSGNITATALADPAFPGEPSVLLADRPFHNIVDGRNVLDFFVDEDTEPKFDGTVDVTDSDLYEATFTGVFGGLGIVTGDVAYLNPGTATCTKWTVISANATTLVCSGVTEVVDATNQTLQVFRTPDDSVQVLNGLNASIDGLVAEPFTIYGSGDLMPENSFFRFFVNSTQYFTISLVGDIGWDGDHTMPQFIAEINDDILTQNPAAPVLMEAVFAPPKVDTVVTVTSIGGINYRATVVSGDLEDFGLQPTMFYLKFITGPNKTLLYRVMALGSSPILYVDFEAPDGITGPFPAKERVQISDKPRLRLRATDAWAAQNTGLKITLSSGYANSGAFTMGFSEGRVATATPITAKQSVEDIAAKGTKITATITSDNVLQVENFARSEPLAPTTIVLYSLRGTAPVAAAGLSITLTTTHTEAELATILPGDTVVLRTADVVNAVFEIDTIVGNVITATGTVGVSSQASVEYEIGSDNIPQVLNHFIQYILYVDNGPNAGRYELVGKGPTPLDCIVRPQLPQRQDTLRKPVFFSTRVVRDIPTFSSITENSSSSVIVHGSALFQFFPFSAPSPRGGGTTTYLLLTSIPTGLQVGDSLEIYEDTYNAPSDVFEITEVVFSANVIRLDRAVPNETVYEISQNKTIPFALLRAKAASSTNGLEERVGTWAALPQNQAQYFTDLNRFINPLLVNANPTAVQVADAQTKLKDLYKILTEAAATAYSGDVSATLESILAAYETEHQPAIDTMVKSFIEKGADKAVDILLEADFEGFFGLDVDSSSYAGDMMKKMRELAREDLPIRKTDRLAAQQNQLLAATEDEDFETSTTDTNVPKPPTG